MLNPKGQLLQCSQCGHGRWVYVLTQPDTYACQRHGWNAKVHVVNLKFLVNNTPTWEAAWGAVKEKYGEDFEDKDTGEWWQYMGTVIHEHGAHAGKAEHQFRHRSWKGKREYFSHYTTHEGLDDYR